MPLNSLHFMSHIVAPHLQNFFTVCYLWAAWGNCAFSSWQAQRFHPVYVVATWASTSMCCILMAVSEPSMYKTCIIALMSPLAGVFLLSKLNIFQQVFGRRPESKLKFKPLWDARVQAWGRNRARTSMKMLRIVAYGFVSLFFTTFSLFFATFSLSYGGVRCRSFYWHLHFLIFSGPGRHQWQEKCEQSPSTPHGSGQRTPLNIPRDMCWLSAT